MNTLPPDARTLSKRASQVVLVAVLMTAASGYFMGLTQITTTRAEAREASHPGFPPDPGSAEVDGSPAVPAIVEYRRLGESDLKPNAGWVSRLGSLRASTPGAPGGAAAGSATPAPASEAERARAVEIRAGRRAFDGAPPVIPHPVDPVSPANCRACHATGLAVRGLVAPKMSHGEMGSCTQCHVSAGGTGLVAAGDLAGLGVDNDFAGLRSAGRGSRVWPGAPPTIPHRLWMRQDCSSCHGPAGLAGLRTSHPERALCQQCHVPDGVADMPPWLRPELAGSAGPDAFNASP